jgi:hypothetical protein
MPVLYTQLFQLMTALLALLLVSPWLCSVPRHSLMLVVYTSTAQQLLLP